MSGYWLIEHPASVEELKLLQDSSPHVAPNQLQRLLEMAAGEETCAPRLTNRGTPRRCQTSGCDNAAMRDARKQRCPTCYIRFLERSNQSRSLPRCETCNAHTHHEFEGRSSCRACASAEQAIRAEKAYAYDAEQVKLRELDDAETVHELREWIKEYLT